MLALLCATRQAWLGSTLPTSRRPLPCRGARRISAVVDLNHVPTQRLSIAVPLRRRTSSRMRMRGQRARHLPGRVEQSSRFDCQPRQDLRRRHYDSHPPEGHGRNEHTMTAMLKAAAARHDILKFRRRCMRRALPCIRSVTGGMERERPSTSTYCAPTASTVDRIKRQGGPDTSGPPCLHLPFLRHRRSLRDSHRRFFSRCCGHWSRPSTLGASDSFARSEPLSAG